MRLVQLEHPSEGRRVGLVEDSSLRLIKPTHRSAYDLIWEALNRESLFPDLVKSYLSPEYLDYDPIYLGKDSWKILPCFDHPHDPLHCVVSGTGLTHKTSAENRASMHQKMKGGDVLSDSMKMYLLGEEGGKPKPGKIGAQPEWFYKGNGTVLKGHLSALEIPSYALDGGEEPELAGVYVINPKGIPVRVGMCIANEFSDHLMEEQNYLYLAPSKLRACAIGPELVLNPDFSEVEGKVLIKRDAKVLWRKDIKTGESHITHSLDNLEYHHFKYAQHRIPGQVHIHFFGAYGLSFSQGIRLRDGDEITIGMNGFGRSLINWVKWDKQEEMPIEISVLL